jgi:hypothetical protein
VLISVPSPKLERYFTPACGSQAFAAGGRLSRCRPALQRGRRGCSTTCPTPASSRATATLGSSPGWSARPSTQAQIPGTVDANGGTNFKTDGVNSLPAGRVAYAVIKAVSGPEAAQIASGDQHARRSWTTLTGSAGIAQVRGAGGLRGGRRRRDRRLRLPRRISEPWNPRGWPCSSAAGPCGPAIARTGWRREFPEAGGRRPRVPGRRPGFARLA